MQTQSLIATEAECAEGRIAPRVSLSDIEANVLSIVFTTGEAIYCSSAIDTAHSKPFPPSASDPLGQRPIPSFGCLTLCLLTTRHGFVIVGKSAPASPANFDAELGRKLAYEDAVRQLWPLMGYALREKLANG